jgi:hypothetical protein
MVLTCGNQEGVMSNGKEEKGRIGEDLNGESMASMCKAIMVKPALTNHPKATTVWCSFWML